MQSEILEAILNLAAGEKAVLATVCSTAGSTPRKTGAQMLVFHDGRLRGSIGGGCGEAEVKRRALEVIRTGQSVLHRVDLTADIAAEEGMACGGYMEVFLDLVP